MAPPALKLPTFDLPNIGWHCSARYATRNFCLSQP